MLEDHAQVDLYTAWPGSFGWASKNKLEHCFINSAGGKTVNGYTVGE